MHRRGRQLNQRWNIHTQPRTTSPWNIKRVLSIHWWGLISRNYGQVKNIKGQRTSATRYRLCNKEGAGQWKDTHVSLNWCKKKSRRHKSGTMSSVIFRGGWKRSHRKNRKVGGWWVQGWGRMRLRGPCAELRHWEDVKVSCKIKPSRMRGKPWTGTQTVTNEPTPFQTRNMTVLKGE